MCSEFMILWIIGWYWSINCSKLSKGKSFQKARFFMYSRVPLPYRECPALSNEQYSLLERFLACKGLFLIANFIFGGVIEVFIQFWGEFGQDTELSTYG
jgi:hypothetical protein